MAVERTVAANGVELHVVEEAAGAWALALVKRSVALDADLTAGRGRVQGFHA